MKITLSHFEKHKQRVINRCLKYNFLPNISQNTKERLSRVYPRSKERINRRYRIAQLEGCILGDLPDQSQVDYTFNSSIEASDINGRWDIKDSASIAGWKVRFYDKDNQSIDKTGFLELRLMNFLEQRWHRVAILTTLNLIPTVLAGKLAVQQMSA